MHFKLLSPKDLKAMEALRNSYGGGKEISSQIESLRDYQIRKKIAAEKGWGEMLEKAEAYTKRFAKLEDFVEKNGIRWTKKGVCTAQVSGFQGARPTFDCIGRVSENADILFPTEMISVVPMTEYYVYGGDLLATLSMAENILGASKFCSTNLIGTPLPEERFARLEKVSGERFERKDLGNGLSQISLKNMGTAFGNLGGVEVGNNNHLVYLDGVTRAALETGANFFLNPSWSTIVAACFYAREIPNLSFKISMLLSTQNAIQLRMLLNIVKEYLRDDGTSAIYEINIGNAATPETFVQCVREIRESGLPPISLAAHLRINPDLGRADFDWTENAHRVLEAGCDITIKYESDGESRPYDTMEAYFLPDEERNAKAGLIGDVIFHKCLRCDKDAKEIMRQGHRAIFARISSRD
ncbi:MAG: hypothetical protein A2V45_09340 [Candidatus Aminicenantes bacterium RBG_19FT_COMBO_58_17]|nr:MAG: hypothetical protein A2V45_09340 [Candidatus Aminicenantes bacterium RBG_19FT_COMBO_58_17]